MNFHLLKFVEVSILRFLIISSAWVYILLVAFGERRFSSLLDMHPGPRGNFMIRLQHSELFLIFCDSQGCFCNQSSYLRMSVKTMHAKRWDTSFRSKCYLKTSLNKSFHAVVCLWMKLQWLGSKYYNCTTHAKLDDYSFWLILWVALTKTVLPFAQPVSGLCVIQL